MPTNLQETIRGYLGQGYKVEEQLSPTSVILLKKGLFRKKLLYLWVDDRSNVQSGRHSLRDLVKKLAVNVRLQRVLAAKLSETCKRYAGRGYSSLDLFSWLLVDEEEKNWQAMEQLKQEQTRIENEIGFRNCLGNMTGPLKEEIMQCLNRGYELKSHTNSSAILERHMPYLKGGETLNLSIGSDGRVQRSGMSKKEMEERHSMLVSLFETYREFKPFPGREKATLDKQFELDAEIKAIHNEMKYLGYLGTMR